MLDELRIIFIETGDPERARRLFQETFDHSLRTKPKGPHRHRSPLPGGVAEFGLLQIIALADFYNSSTTTIPPSASGESQYQTAIHVIRRGARWVDGRLPESDAYDTLADDREFDLPGRRKDGYEPVEYHGLDVNLRERLAVARLRLGDSEESAVRPLTHERANEWTNDGLFVSVSKDARVDIALGGYIGLSRPICGSCRCVFRDGDVRRSAANLWGLECKRRGQKKFD